MKKSDQPSSRTTEAAPRYNSFRVIAAKRKRSEGWSICIAAADGHDLPARFEEAGLAAGTMAELSRGGMRDAVPKLAVLFGEAFDYTCGGGWSFDHQAECWRAPDEPLREMEPGAWTDTIEFRLDAPEAGWLDIQFRAAGQCFDVRLPNTSDRLPEFVEWLRMVWRGSSERFFYDLEGSEMELHLWPAGEGEVHLIGAHNTRIGRRVELNVVTTRQGLVASLYTPLVQFWESPLLTHNWREWSYYTEEAGIEVDEYGYRRLPYALRSLELDRAVASWARR